MTIHLIDKAADIYCRALEMLLVLLLGAMVLIFLGRHFGWR